MFQELEVVRGDNAASDCGTICRVREHNNNHRPRINVVWWLVSSVTGLDLTKQENMLWFVCTKIIESKPAKQETCCTVSIPLTLSVFSYLGQPRFEVRILCTTGSPFRIEFVIPRGVRVFVVGTVVVVIDAVVDVKNVVIVVKVRVDIGRVFDQQLLGPKL